MIIPVLMFLLQKKIPSFLGAGAIWLCISFFLLPAFLTDQYWTNPKEDQILTVYFANTLVSNNNTDLITSSISASNADIVVLTEITPENFAKVSENLVASYPHKNIAPGYSHGLTMAYLSSKELEKEFQIHDFIPSSERDIPVIEMSVQHENSFVTVLGLHPYPPLQGEKSIWQLEQFENLDNYISTLTNPVVVVGDFNATPWSKPLSLFQKSNLKNSRNGAGIVGTWPTWLPAIARIPIDHGLVSDDFRVIDFSIGKETGSDHFPIIIELSIEKKPKLF